MRLIDKDKIYSDLYDADAITFAGLRMLANADEVDAVAVVRCMYCRRGEKTLDETILCHFWDIEFMPGDFCSYGERREVKDDGKL